MKQLITAIFLVICGVFCAQSTSASNERILTKGTWGQEDIRTIFPAPPAASIDGTNLTIDFIHPLTNLTVQIVDNTGSVVFEELISGSAQESYTIPLNLQCGEYILNMSHRYGFLTGSFVIE